MSWSFSPEQVEEFWDRCFSGTVPFVLSSTTHTPDQYYWPDRPTEHSRISRFGTTCEPLTAIHGEALLMWYLEVSRARISASPDEEPDWAEKDPAYGRRWHGLCARYNHDTCSLKTVQPSLLADSTECLPTLPRWGLMLDGDVFQLETVAPHMRETGYGYWRTPTVGMINADRAKDQDYSMRKKEKGQTITLADQVRDVRMWPTPTAHNAKETNAPSEALRNTPTLASTVGGRLNPNWTEWLMGWPIGHTGLKPLATDKFREFVQSHGKR